MMASSVSDSYLHRNAAHQGFLSQANHVIRKGVNYQHQQLTEFEAAISTLEQDNGGPTMTSSGINLSSSRATKQRARNTGPLGLHRVSLSAADTTGDSGIGTGSECDGERPSRSGGRAAVTIRDSQLCCLRFDGIVEEDITMCLLDEGDHRSP